MTSFRFLIELESQGFRVEVRQGVLYIAPKEEVTDELRVRIKEYSTKLIALFESELKSFGLCSVCGLRIITFNDLCEVDFDRQFEEVQQQCLSPNNVIPIKRTRKANTKASQEPATSLF